ncbi:Spore coat polysaccharide biosynthesis protein SpsC [uncultured Gammaproteobacteria bacterium]
MKVDFFRHTLGEAELASVAETLSSMFLTTGPRTAQFERRFAESLGVAHCVGVSSWTMGNLITLKALNIGPGDEVITTPLTFVATANTVLQCGATLVLADVEPECGTLDPARVEAAITPRTRAIIPVHLYGQMCDMVTLRALAARHGLAMIEDAAHSIEGSRDGLKPGQASSAAIFSFYATKTMTCGEGGAIVTNDEALYQRLLRLRLHGMNKSAADRYHGLYQHWDVDELGWKCNMNDLQAALLLPQLARLDQARDRRAAIAARYVAGLSGVEGVAWPKVRRNGVHAHHLFTIWVDPERRDTVLHRLQQAGIGVAVNFRALHLLRYYRERLGYRRGQYPEAERIGDATISLPFHPGLSDAEVDTVVEQVRLAVDQA